SRRRTSRRRAKTGRAAGPGARADAGGGAAARDRRSPERGCRQPRWSASWRAACCDPTKGAGAMDREEPFTSRDVTVEAGGVGLAGTLTIPPDPIGVVLFAHGSGSSRLSPRNRHVAGALHRRGLG